MSISSRADSPEMSSGSCPTQLSFVDGLQACAVFVLVLIHAGAGFAPGGAAAWIQRVFGRGFMSGHGVLAVLSVLYGYCTLQAISADGSRPTRSPSAWLLRCSWRVIPPYYVSLVLSLVAIAICPALREPDTSTLWQGTVPAFSPGAILSHLFLIHNWVPRWGLRINGPLWAIGTLWQISATFTFALLPAWGRIGPVRTLLVATAAGLVPAMAAPAFASLAGSWFLGLFALGMYVADRQRSSIIGHAGISAAILVWMAPAAASAYLAVSLATPPGCLRCLPFTDELLGLATAGVLLRQGRPRSTSTRPDAASTRRWLESPLLVSCHTISYSLFLTHLPVLALCHHALLRYRLPMALHVSAMLLAGVGATFVVAWGFFVTIERRFIGPPPTRAFFKRLIWAMPASATAVLATAVLIERALEVRDLTRVGGRLEYLEVEHRKVRYHLSQSSGASPVVVLLSATAPMDEWNLVANDLAPFARVLQYDRCGIGFSDPLRGSCTAERGTDELAAVLDALGIHAPVVLVGYSISGVLEQAFFRRKPSRVAGMVFVDTPLAGTREALRSAGLPDTGENYRRGLRKYAFLSVLGLIRPAALLKEVDAPDDFLWRTAYFRRNNWCALSDMFIAFSNATAPEVASDGYGLLPMQVLSLAREDEPSGRVILALQRNFVAQSKQATLRRLDGIAHQRGVTDEDARVQILGAIREVIALAFPAAAVP